MYYFFSIGWWQKCKHLINKLTMEKGKRWQSRWADHEELKTRKKCCTWRRYRRSKLFSEIQSSTVPTRIAKRKTSIISATGRFAPPRVIPGQWLKWSLVTCFFFVASCGSKQESLLDGSVNTQRTRGSGLDPDHIRFPVWIDAKKKQTDVHDPEKKGSEFPLFGSYQGV